MDGLRMLTKGTPAQKLQFLFDVYDVDGNIFFFLNVEWIWVYLIALMLL